MALRKIDILPCILVTSLKGNFPCLQIERCLENCGEWDTMEINGLLKPQIPRCAIEHCHVPNSSRL